MLGTKLVEWKCSGRMWCGVKSSRWIRLDICFVKNQRWSVEKFQGLTRIKSSQMAQNTWPLKVFTRARSFGRRLLLFSRWSWFYWAPSIPSIPSREALQELQDQLEEQVSKSKDSLPPRPECHHLGMVQNGQNVGYPSNWMNWIYGYGSIPIFIPFLVGWTSIYQLFWGSPGVQGFEWFWPIPIYIYIYMTYTWLIHVHTKHHRRSRNLESPSLRAENFQRHDLTGMMGIFRVTIPGSPVRLVHYDEIFRYPIAYINSLYIYIMYINYCII